jgi:hypothetical protein
MFMSMPTKLKAMTKNALICLIVLLSSSPCFSEDKYVLPENSSWTPVKIGTYGSPSEFSGVIEFKGSFHITWSDHPEYPEYIVAFYPNEPLSGLIPIFTEIKAPKAVTFAKPDSVAAKLVPNKQMLADLKHGSIPSITGDAVIIASNLFSAIDCNHRTYILDFISAESVTKVSASDPSSFNSSC